MTNQQILERMIRRARAGHRLAQWELQRARESGDPVDIRLAEANLVACREKVEQLKNDEAAEFRRSLLTILRWIEDQWLRIKAEQARAKNS